SVPRRIVAITASPATPQKVVRRPARTWVRCEGRHVKALVVDVTKTAAVTVVKELASASDGGERGFLPGDILLVTDMVKVRGFFRVRSAGSTQFRVRIEATSLDVNVAAVVELERSTWKDIVEEQKTMNKEGKLPGRRKESSRTHTNACKALQVKQPSTVKEV
ncbi:hypothetical protein LSAT2_001416, partial [Lamellibrachia satsuma]